MTPNAPEPGRDGWRDAVADPPDTNRLVMILRDNGMQVEAFLERELGWMAMNGRNVTRVKAWREIE